MKLKKFLTESTKKLQKESFIGNFDQKFKEFFEKVTDMLNKHQSKDVVQRAISVQDGKRYKKIVFGTSAWAFVAKETGDILKPASWSAPAKHARGNIGDAFGGMKYLTPYGPASLK